MFVFMMKWRNKVTIVIETAVFFCYWCCAFRTHTLYANELNAWRAAVTLATVEGSPRLTTRTALLLQPLGCRGCKAQVCLFYLLLAAFASRQRILTQIDDAFTNLSIHAYQQNIISVYQSSFDGSLLARMRACMSPSQVLYSLPQVYNKICFFFILLCLWTRFRCSYRRTRRQVLVNTGCAELSYRINRLLEFSSRWS